METTKDQIKIFEYSETLGPGNHHFARSYNLDGTRNWIITTTHPTPMRTTRTVTDLTLPPETDTP